MGITLRKDMTLEPRPELGPDTYALSGTPTDCMMVALDATKGIMRALDLHPVLALSGPNYGPNMGTDVLLSGTVGAARTAGLYGVPAIAASSTCMDRTSDLENAVRMTQTLAAVALQCAGSQPARNWPRSHTRMGTSGKRHVLGTCEYDTLPAGWVLDVESVLLDAFLDGDLFLNLNVPADFQPESGCVQTTGLGLMFYKDSYVVSVPEVDLTRPPATHQYQGQGAPGMSVASSMDSIVSHSIMGPAAGGHGSGHGNGNGNGGRPPSVGVEEIASALCAGRPVVYNNAFDTRRSEPVERSDVLALQSGHACITTLQTWPEGHTLCLSDRAMARALLSTHEGLPSWLQSGRVRRVASHA